MEATHDQSADADAFEFDLYHATAYVRKGNHGLFAKRMDIRPRQRIHSMQSLPPVFDR